VTDTLSLHDALPILYDTDLKLIIIAYIKLLKKKFSILQHTICQTEMPAIEIIKLKGQDFPVVFKVT
jgi:hypothetical protein